MPELPQIIKIKRVLRETGEHHTLFFDFDAEATPGQFLMVWIPGVDEKPISLSKISKGELAITVQCKGNWSKRVCGFGEGTKLGVRGPYGNGFSTKGVKKAVIVAGGCGSAPLMPLVEKCLANGIETKFILGAQTADKLLFKKELAEKLGNNLYITTDDGSEGTKGFTTQTLEELLGKEKPDCVYSCGPEIMMKGVLDICLKKKVKSQLSLERYMRCGFGVCGQCVMDDLMVCKDGPVFSGKTLSESVEFGKLTRLKSGKEASLKEFGDWRQC
jgi:dihydroorotate dehydrogenase electron transfer subunit